MTIKRKRREDAEIMNISEAGPETKKFMRKAHMVRLGVMPFYIAVYELLFIIPRDGLGLFLVQMVTGAICLTMTTLIDRLVLKLRHDKGLMNYPECAEPDTETGESSDNSTIAASDIRADINDETNIGFRKTKTILLENGNNRFTEV